MGILRLYVFVPLLSCSCTAPKAIRRFWKKCISTLKTHSGLSHVSEGLTVSLYVLAGHTKHRLLIHRNNLLFLFLRKKNLLIRCSKCAHMLEAILWLYQLRPIGKMESSRGQRSKTGCCMKEKNEMRERSKNIYGWLYCVWKNKCYLPTYSNIHFYYDIIFEGSVESLLCK